MSMYLWTLSLPQFAMFTGIGAMKSFSSAGNDAEERLFRNAEPKCTHWFCGNTFAAVRLMPASPNSLPGMSKPPLGGGLLSWTVPVLIAPSATPAALRSTRLPQQGSALDARQSLTLSPFASVSHLSRPSTGFAPPLVKSNVTRMSPAVRRGVLLPVARVELWLNSKSMLALPSTFERSHARYR